MLLQGLRDLAEKRCGIRVYRVFSANYYLTQTAYFSISSVAASHSLTLRNCLRNIILRRALSSVKGLLTPCAERCGESGCIWMTIFGPECGHYGRGVSMAE